MHHERTQRGLRPVLALGAHLKNTVALGWARQIVVSQHLGDLETAASLEAFRAAIRDLRELYGFKPELVACDLHPDYLPTRWAESRAASETLPLVRIQHHYAHIASCMADNRVSGPVIGVALDGTGYGTDGKIWGGEFMVADFKHFERKAHLESLPLPGGAAAIQKPYRAAIGYLYSLLGRDSLKSGMIAGMAAPERSMHIWLRLRMEMIFRFMSVRCALPLQSIMAPHFLRTLFSTS